MNDLKTDDDLGLLDLTAEEQAALAPIEAELTELGREVREMMIRWGELLDRARSVMSANREGQFLNWARARFGLSRRKVYDFLHAYEHPEKLPEIGNIGKSALSLLAQPSTPQEACDAIADRAASGEPVRLRDVKDAIAKARGAEEPSAIGDGDDEASPEGAEQPEGSGDSEEAGGEEDQQGMEPIGQATEGDGPADEAEAGEDRTIRESRIVADDEVPDAAADKKARQQRRAVVIEALTEPFMEAFDQFKMAVIHERNKNWINVPRETVLSMLDLMREFVDE